jgi:hypothetical protein
MRVDLVVPQLGEDGAVIDAPQGVLVEVPVPVLAQEVDQLPFGLSCRPACMNALAESTLQSFGRRGVFPSYVLRFLSSFFYENCIIYLNLLLLEMLPK